MSQDVVTLLFPGDSAQLLPRYAEAAHRFRDGGNPSPDQTIVAHTDDGLLVVLVWGQGVNHDRLGAHVQGLLGELELPFPRVDHGTLAVDSWETLTLVR